MYFGAVILDTQANTPAVPDDDDSVRGRVAANDLTFRQATYPSHGPFLSIDRIWLPHYWTGKLR